MRKLLDKAKEIRSRSRSANQAPAECFVPPVVSFPDGVKVLYNCTDASVDICFVHGLTGNREDTWTANGERTSWPEALLPSRLQKARILTYGYDAYVLRKSVASSNRLIDHSTNLLNDLAAERACSDALSRPIIFVAHSLGGLVCKHALLLSQNKAETHLKSISIYTKGIMFLGTPHSGSWMADWAKIPASALGFMKSTNKSLLKILETDDQLLESIQIDFLSMLRSLSSNAVILQVTCFFEELPLPGIGKIVSKESATFAGYTPISIHANHSDMVKFASAEETGFKRVVAELVRWEAEIRTNSRSPAHFNSKEKREEYEKPSSNNEEQPCSKKLYTRCIAGFLNLSSDERSDMAIAKVIEALKLEIDARRLFKLHSTKRWEHHNDREVRELEDKIKRSYDAGARRCLKSLSFSEMKLREADIDRPTKDTCVWIYRNPVYRSWEAQQHKLLWIKGHPGSGKSVLMKSLYSKRKQMPTSTKSPMILSFFFNARGAAIEKTPLGLYITMLHDLLKWIPVALCEFLPHFLEKEMISAGDKVSWNLVEVADAFHQIIACKQPRPIEVLIDALDECKEDEVRSVIRNFESTIADARLSGAELKVCWSSRYYPHISLVSEDGLELLLDEQNNGDITRYVSREFPTESDAFLLSMQSDLIRKSDGVFLWAVLVIRQLNAAIDKGKTEFELRHLINSIPTKLEDLFNNIFQDIEVSASQREELLRICQWVFCSERPLTAAVLFTALQLQSGPQTCSILACNPTEQDIDRLLRRIVDVSGGLLEFASPYRHERDNYDEIDAGDESDVIYDSAVRWVSDASDKDDAVYPFNMLRFLGSKDDQWELWELGNEPEIHDPDKRIFTTKVQVIHESVRDFFLGSKGRKLLRVSSADDFFLGAHKYMTQICFKALLSSEFTGPVAGTRRLDSFSEISSLLSVYLKPPDNDLLMYAHDFGFVHCDKARDRLSFSTSAETPFCSVESRRQALVNSLRFWCAGVIQEWHVQKVLDMCIVGKDPAAFGLERAEYRALRYFLDDFYVFRQSFQRLLILRISDNPDEKRNNSDCTAFHALYFVDSSLRMNHLYPSIKVDDTNLERLFLRLTSTGVDLRFVFAATFWIAGEHATARLRDRLAQSYDNWMFGEMQIENWAIEDDIHNLVDLIEEHRFLLDCKKARLHDYNKPGVLCAVLEARREKEGTTSRILPATKHRYGESIVGHMSFERLDNGYLRRVGVPPRLRWSHVAKAYLEE